MNFKDYLLTLDWNAFSRYPPQNEPIYLYAISEDMSSHKFLKVNKFNAFTFEPRVIMAEFGINKNWKFYWLPSVEINEF